MKKTIFLDDLNQINRKDKENLLSLLLNLEMKEILNNQELDFSYLQKDD